MPHSAQGRDDTERYVPATLSHLARPHASALGLAGEQVAARDQRRARRPSVVVVHRPRVIDVLQGWH